MNHNESQAGASARSPGQKNPPGPRARSQMEDCAGEENLQAKLQSHQSRARSYSFSASGFVSFCLVDF